jgi:CrcB protein
VFGLCLRSALFEQNWRVFLAAGVCGGFTTYSAFSMEMVALLQQHKFILFAVYLLATIACGLVATWLGYSFVK